MADLRDPARISELLEPQARRIGMDSGVLVGRVWASWPHIVGPEVAAHAEPTSLRKGVLRVRADSPAWSTELSYLADELRRRINEAVAHDLVEEVRVWSGPGRVSRPRGPAADATVTDVPSTGGDPVEALRRAREAWSRRQGGRV
jgi:predicted nucleic acid-binding Zn ribbon protein